MIAMMLASVLGAGQPGTDQASQTDPPTKPDRSPAEPITTLPERAMTTIADALKALQSRGDFRELQKRHPHGPLGNPAQFFGADNYPPAALCAGKQGRVVTRLSIGIDGKVTGCIVETSSGSASLDEATCAIALHRATYIPAVDERGKPIASTIPLAVRWALPNDGPALPLNASLSVQLTIATDGTIESCESEPDVPAGELGPCTQWRVGRKVMVPPTRDGRPVKAHVAITSEIATVLDP